MKCVSELSKLCHATLSKAEDQSVFPAIDPTANPVRSEPVTIVATDGFRLSAHVYSAAIVRRTSTVVVINGGAGIRQRFYEPFAEFLASTGTPVVLYDYRGIGGSRPRSLVGFAASVEDWGSKDCAAVINWTTERFAGATLCVVGHSVGTLVTGFVTNGRLIDKMVLIGAHTGYWGDYRKDLRPVMFVAWHLFTPLITRLIGFFPGKALRVGEDLPTGVALQWAARRRPDLWWNVRNERGCRDFERIAKLRARFEAIRAPALGISFTDDAFSTESATQRLAALYSNCAVTQERINPSVLDVRRAGHFAFFRPNVSASQWARVAEWIANPAAS